MASKFDVKIGDIKKGVVNNKNVRLAIVKQAVVYWNLLPKHTRMWYSITDMIAEGINHVVMHVASRYKKSLSQVITFVTHCVRNHYINVVKFYWAEERRDHKTVSLDTMVDLRYTGSFENLVIARIDGEAAFLKLYSAADDKTRKYIIKWLLQPRFSRNKEGENFAEAKYQFEALSHQYGLTYELCSAILSDEALRTKIAKKLIFHYRTPKRSSSKPILRESLEGDLLPVVMPYACRT